MHAWKQDTLGSQVTSLTDLPHELRSRKLGHVKINGCMLATSRRVIDATDARSSGD